MKYSTAKKLVNRMIAGETVSLRKNRFGGMSEKTWEAIWGVLFHDYGVNNLNGKYINGVATINADHVLVNVVAKLF